MAINAYGNEDFSAFFQGAQVGNMIALRAQRAQQLRSQQALDAVHERLLAAQADQIAANIQKQKQLEADIHDTADTMDRMVHEGMNTHPFEPGQDTAPVLEMYKRQAEDWAARNHPEAALVIGKAKEAMEGRQADVERARHNQVMESLRAQEVGDEAKRAEGVGKITAVVNPATGKKVGVLQTSPTGATLVEAKRAEGALSPVDMEELKGLNRQLGKVDDSFNRLITNPPTDDPDKLLEMKSQLISQRAQVMKRINRLKGAASAPAAKSGLLRFVPGKGIIPAEESEGEE